jgi:hypothetical protein
MGWCGFVVLLPGWFSTIVGKSSRFLTPECFVLIFFVISGLSNPGGEIESAIGSVGRAAGFSVLVLFDAGAAATQYAKMAAAVHALSFIMF